MKPFYNTWDKADSNEGRMETLQEQLTGFSSQLEWAEDYVSRLRAAIDKKQHEFDLLAEIEMKHQ